MMQEQQADATQGQKRLTLTIPANATPEVRGYLEHLGCTFRPIAGESKREYLDLPPEAKRSFIERWGVSERHIITLPGRVTLYETYDFRRELSGLSFDQEGMLAFLLHKK